MSFLFGKKKPGARDTATPASTAGTGTARDKDSKLSAGPPSSATPASSINTSVNSFGNGSPDQRGKIEQEIPPQQQFAPRPMMNGAPQTLNNANPYPWSQRPLNYAGSGPLPFPRYGAAVNMVASKEGDIYIMGGLVGGSTVKGDLWMVEAGSGNLSCFSVRTEAEGPGPRVGHASLLVGNAFIVFGGDTKQDENDELDDKLYLLNTSTKQWSRSLPPGPRPSGRYGHTLNILGSKLYVFGGQVDGHFFNDLVAFDLNQLASPTNRWEMLVADNTEEGFVGKQIPHGRTNHTVVTWNDRLYLFGGTDGVSWFNDVWAFDPRSNTWTQLDCIGYIPQPREGHSAALVGDVMYIFGGRTQEGDDLGDLAAFRITSRRWYTFQNMGPSPSPRSGHSMTAYDTQIIVLAGEPSAAQRDEDELSFAYVLDTAKIRYPNDQLVQQTPVGERVLGNRRPSAERNGSRGLSSREGLPMTNGPPQLASGPRLPRSASNSVSASGPPPLQQPPPPQSHTMPPHQGAQQQGPPRVNGSGVPLAGPRSRTPTRDNRPLGPGLEANRGPSFDRPDNRHEAVLGGIDGQRSGPSRSLSPTLNAGPQAMQQPTKFASGYPEEQYNMSTSAALRAQPQARQPRQSPTDGVAGQPQEPPQQQQQHQPLQQQQPPQQQSLQQQPMQQPPLQQHQAQSAPPQGARNITPSGTRETPQLQNSTTQENNDLSTRKLKALQKELEHAKKSNVWYTTELALARKAGYGSAGQRASLDGTTKSLEDDDRPLIEALMTMRTELANVKGDFSTRIEDAAQKVSEVEQQRDAAIKEAVYAKAKLAAHGGTPPGSPQLDDSARDIDSSDRAGDNLRKLGTALAMQRELQSKLDAALAQHAAEKRAREIAEESAEAAHRRATELDQAQVPGELESLRAELHDAQKIAREELARRSDAHSRMKMLEVDKEDVERQLETSTTKLTDHGSMLVSLRSAVGASQEKYTLLEKKLQQEREGRETLQMKLMQLRTEHEEQTTELETTSKKLRDAEELAEKHAAEAETHRNLVVTGLDKLNTRKHDDNQSGVTERRVAILQQQVKEANALVSKSQSEADAASEKLRRAEERIAGLEAYQQQASREGLSIRKQLQEAVRAAHGFQSQHAEVRQRLESHQRDAAALAVQHGALKDLLDERSASRNNDSPRLDTPDAARMRELEAMLEESEKAHADTKASFDAREQESEKEYREKIEQLEQDYQSAVSYVRGTEKMLKRMKDELARSKAHSNKLQADLDTQQSRGLGSTGEVDAPAGWEAERQALHREVEEMQTTMQGSVYELEQQMGAIKGELRSAETDRDNARHKADQMANLTRQLQHNLDTLRADNAALEARATDAEGKVGLLLDRVESSVDSYRRRSGTGPHPNGGASAPAATSNHTRETSATSGFTSVTGHSQSNSIGGDSTASSSGGAGGHVADRNSMALDNLASELEDLRNQWEGRNTYRLSHHSEMERSPGGASAGNPGGSELSSSLASWRKRLDAEDREKEQTARMATGAEQKVGVSGH